MKTDQLSARDWLDQGLKTLARSGFTALKAEPLAKAMGVSRGSFYWHFADIGASTPRGWGIGARLPPKRSSPMSRRRRNMKTR